MAGFSQAKIRDFVSSFDDQEFFVGVDVHKRSYHICLKRQDDRVLNWVSPSSNNQLV